MNENKKLLVEVEYDWRRGFWGSTNEKFVINDTSECRQKVCNKYINHPNVDDRDFVKGNKDIIEYDDPIYVRIEVVPISRRCDIIERDYRRSMQELERLKKDASRY